MRTFNASLFLFAALALTHAAALPTNYRRQSSSSSPDFECPRTDTDGVSLSGNTIDGDIITCFYNSTVCSYALENGNQVIEQDGSMSGAAPPSCPPNADPSSSSSSASATSTASASASTSSASPDFECPRTDTDGVSLSGNTIDGDIITCFYNSTVCSYALENGNQVIEQDGSMSGAAPPSCPPNADPSSTSSSASATSTASASASTSSASSVDFKCPPTDTDGVSLSNSTVEGDILTCSYDTSLGPRTCDYTLQNGSQVIEQDGSMSGAAPPSCPPNADPSDGSSPGSDSSESQALASLIALLEQLFGKGSSS
ncbi:hypothetical protein MVEN_01653900 [Mycena venus]|uniref:Uncharacterized protein n=1 Tax=Mycena venus TaxID=2733690 RepID=A0A8H6XRB3_9AGAR|nr:hypothetical protein MVEN_01653900 [Mycena venus]